MHYYSSSSFFFLLLFPVKTTAWRTSRSPCPKDTRTGSSPTATVATGSRWPCRSTWRRCWDAGTDRELGTKDVDSPICSVVASGRTAPSCCTYIQSLTQSHSDISDQPVDCACVLSTCIYVWSKAIKMNILIIISFFFSFCTNKQQQKKRRRTWHRHSCGPIFYFSC